LSYAVLFIGGLTLRKDSMLIRKRLEQGYICLSEGVHLRLAIDKYILTPFISKY